MAREFLRRGEAMESFASARTLLRVLKARRAALERAGREHHAEPCTFTSVVKTAAVVQGVQIAPWSFVAVAKSRAAHDGLLPRCSRRRRLSA